MMVDRRHRMGKCDPKPFAGATMIGTIHKYGRQAGSDRQHIIGAQEVHPLDEEAQPPWHGVRIHADSLDSSARQKPRKGHLGTYAVTIRSCVPHHCNTTPLQSVEQGGKTLGEGGKMCGHDG